MAAQHLYRNPRVPGDAEAHFRCAARKEKIGEGRHKPNIGESRRLSVHYRTIHRYEAQENVLTHFTSRHHCRKSAPLFPGLQQQTISTSTCRRFVVFFEAFHNNPSTNPCSVLFVRRRPSCYGRGFYSPLPPLWKRECFFGEGQLNFTWIVWIVWFGWEHYRLAVDR